MKNFLHAMEKIDQNWSSALREKLKYSPYNKLFPLIGHVGNAVVTLSICLAMIIFGNSTVRHIGIGALISLVISHIVVQGLKYAIRRQRPPEHVGQGNFSILFDRYSFPSGHTTAAFSIATSVSFSIPLLSVIAFPLAAMVGISRIYIGVHYPTDVFAGFTIATVTSLLLSFT